MDTPTDSSCINHSAAMPYQILNHSSSLVRLPLGELENRGLVFHKQHRSTFANGRSTRIHRLIAVLLKTPQHAENSALIEFLRGVQTVMRPLRASLVLIGHSPEEWRPELVSVLAGVIVMPEEVTTKELENLKDRNLPFFIFGESELPGPRILLKNRNAEENTHSSTNFFTVGRLVAEALNLAALTGEPVSEPIPSTLNLSPQASCRI